MMIHADSTEDAKCEKCGESMLNSAITDSFLLGGADGPLVQMGAQGHIHLHGLVITNLRLHTWRGFLKYKLGRRTR